MVTKIHVFIQAQNNQHNNKMTRNLQEMAFEIYENFLKIHIFCLWVFSKYGVINVHVRNIFMIYGWLFFFSLLPLNQAIT